MELRKTFQFEAAHLLPFLPKTQSAAACTATVSKVEIAVAGECDPKLGWVMDYADITAAFKPPGRAARPLLSQRHSRPRKPDQRECRRVDLEELKRKLPLLTEIVVAETCTVPLRVPRRRGNVKRET